MVNAYNYRIDYVNGCHWIYLNEILFGTLSKVSGNSWHVNIEISGEDFLFTKFGVLKPSIYIQDINSGEAFGNITIPIIPFLSRKIKFIYKGGKKMIWVGKNFLSFHWLWRTNTKTVIEAVEDITTGNKNGVITMSSYINDSNLLIITGVFLSLRSKGRLALGLVNKQHVYSWGKNKRPGMIRMNEL